MIVCSSLLSFLKRSVHHQVPTFKWSYCHNLPGCRKVNVNMLVNIISRRRSWWCTTGFTMVFLSGECRKGYFLSHRIILDCGSNLCHSKNLHSRTKMRHSMLQECWKTCSLGCQMQYGMRQRSEIFLTGGLLPRSRVSGFVHIYKK